MRITAIFDTTESADQAAGAIAERMTVTNRRTIQLTGSDDYVSPELSLTPYIALGYENAAASGGVGMAGSGIWPQAQPFPVPWTSVTAEQARNEISSEVRLELDISSADLHTAESIIINRHGRAITCY